MSKIKSIILALFLVITWTLTAQAQEEKFLYDRIERTVTTLRPKLELSVRRVEKSYTLFIWGLETKPEQKYALAVFITVHASPERARMVLECGPEPYCLQNETRVLDTKVNGLGDGNYFWESLNGKERGISFIKGRYHVRLYTFDKSFEAVRKVAWYIKGLFPTPNNSLNRSANSEAFIENLNDFDVVCAPG